MRDGRIVVDLIGLTTPMAKRYATVWELKQLGRKVEKMLLGLGYTCRVTTEGGESDEC